MNTALSLCDEWGFCKVFSEEMHSHSFTAFEKVRIPHNAIDLPFSYCNEEDYQLICGYRYVLNVPKAWEKHSIRIKFDGVAHKSVLYVNGVPAAEHRCGYTAFEAEISQMLLLDQDNIIVLKADSCESGVPPFGKVIDYLTYAGIYREVTLKVTPLTYINDAFVKTPQTSLEKSLFSADISLRVENEYAYLSAQILTTDGSLFKALGDFPASKSINIQREIKGALLWNLDNPTLYILRLTLTKSGELLDSLDVRFGFRTCLFKADGFYLNGNKIKLLGLNRHQSWPYVGYAMPKRAQRLDAQILKTELGVNAVRTSHYPQSHHFINACDELGLLVFTELPGWQHIGGKSWKKQAVQNTRDMVLQYRNHPSIILWGVRINESADDDAFFTDTNAEAHRLDPTRQTGGVRNFTKSSFLEDVYTYNDFVHSGDNRGLIGKNEASPDISRGYLVSEYGGHMHPTKTYDNEAHRQNNALRHATILNEAAMQPDIAGSFGWCAFDYNTHKEFGSGDRICHHGVMDMFRNPKGTAAVYKSQNSDNPVLYITSEMNIGDYPATLIGDIYAFTNADSINVYKNDELVGEYKPSSKYSSLSHAPVLINDIVGDLLIKHEGFDKKTSDKIKRALIAVAKNGQSGMSLKEKLNMAYLMVFKRLSYARGVELFDRYFASWGSSSTSYRFEGVKNGACMASVTKEAVLKTSLVLNADTLALHEDGSYDVATVRLIACDQNGNTLYYCMEAVKIIIEGPLELIGPSTAMLRGGMGGAYFKTTGKTGSAHVTFICEGIGEASLDFIIAR